MRVTSPTYAFEDLRVGMEVNIINPFKQGKLQRAVITRLHTVRTEKFLVGKFPTNSRRGGCDYSTYDGEVYASLRSYSEDGEPLEDGCRDGNCIHVRYKNNVKGVVDRCYIRPLNPLKLLAEQGQ